MLLIHKIHESWKDYEIESAAAIAKYVCIDLGIEKEKIEISFRKKRKKYCGLCEKKKGKIRVILYRHKKYLMTLAHELVHAKQFATEELGENMEWYGVPKLWKKLPYTKLPWEIEAFQYEEVIRERLKL